jgi:hypothetical protein
MKRIAWLLLLAAFACGPLTEAAPPADTQSTPADTDSETAAEPTTPPEPTDGPAEPEPAEEQFNIVIEPGIYTLTPEEANASDQDISGVMRVEFDYSEYLLDEETTVAYTVYMEFDQPIESGTYTADDIFMGVQYVDQSVPETVQCRADEGTVTIERSGNTMSGDLNFSEMDCSFYNGDPAEVDVQASGTFENIDINPAE